jgi:dTMP kinase
VSSDDAVGSRWERYGATSDAPDHDVRGVLAIRPFRQLWLSLGLSSFGDWLGLLATTAMASNLGAQSGYAAANLAVAGVLILRLAPAILVGPLAGAVADRLDRKLTMVVGDVLRFGLFASIAVVGTLWWLFIATILIEVIGLFWLPAKDATVPNLVPRQRLEAANQLSLATTYGSAPFAALLFSGLTLVSGALDNVVGFIGAPIDLAMYANALTYMVAALVVWQLPMPRRARAGEAAVSRPSVWRTIVDGWRFVGTTPLVRGLVIGMLGAFGAGGFVIGVAPTFVSDLGAGEPGYGVLFASVFTGLAGGMWVGPRLLAELPRWRLFSVSIVVAGGFLALVALIPNIVLAALFTTALGAGAGVAWVTGYTMLGLEVADELRGRTFGFVQSSARVVLVAVMALAPALAALLGRHELHFTPLVSLTYNGAALTLLLAAVLAVAIGVIAYRQMDDGSGVPLTEDLVRAWRLRHVAHPPSRPRTGDGFFIALEGGDGAGKSTQARMLEHWLSEELGHEVVLTHEPGATPTGRRLREILLHGDELDARSEALLFAADRAQHVATVVRPALARGAVVVTDRFSDSSVAYQGAGRDLDGEEVARLSRWATRGLVPDLTVVLDVPPDIGRGRAGGDADRLESEPDAFHTAVRQRFLDLARREPRRYLVLDATGAPADVHRQVVERLAPLLPLSPRQRREAEERQARAEEQRAREEAERERREAEEAQRRAREAEERRQAEERERRRRDEEARARREQEERAHPEALRRASGADDDTETKTMPAVDPTPTRSLDLGEELFGLDDDESSRRR